MNVTERRRRINLTAQVDALDGGATPRSSSEHRKLRELAARINALDDVTIVGPITDHSLLISLEDRATAAAEDVPPEDGGDEDGFFDDFDGDTLDPAWNVVDLTPVFGVALGGFSVAGGHLVLEDGALPGGFMDLPDLAGDSWIATMECALDAMNSTTPQMAMSVGDNILVAGLLTPSMGSLGFQFGDANASTTFGFAEMSAEFPADGESYWVRIEKTLEDMTAQYWLTDPQLGGDPDDEAVFPLTGDAAVLAVETTPGLFDFNADADLVLSFRVEQS